MAVTYAQFTTEARDIIAATIDEVEGMFVPNDPANRHRQRIAEWEAEGNQIEDPEPVAATKPGP